MYTMPVIIPTDSFADISDLAHIQKVIKSELTSKGFTVEYPELPMVYDIDGDPGLCLISFDTPQLFILKSSIEGINKSLLNADIDISISIPTQYTKNGTFELDPYGCFLLVNAS